MGSAIEYLFITLPMSCPEETMMTCSGLRVDREMLSNKRPMAIGRFRVGINIATASTTPTSVLAIETLFSR